MLLTPNLTFPALICIPAFQQQQMSASYSSYSSSSVFAPAAIQIALLIVIDVLIQCFKIGGLLYC